MRSAARNSGLPDALNELQHARRDTMCVNSIRACAVVMRPGRPLAPPLRGQVPRGRAEHREAGEDFDEQAVVEPIFAGARIVDGAEDADALEQLREALRRRRRARDEFPQRRDEHRQFERLAVHLPEHAPTAVEDRHLRQVIEAGRRRDPDEAEIAREAVDVAASAAEKFPVREGRCPGASGIRALPPACRTAD